MVRSACTANDAHFPFRNYPDRFHGYDLSLPKGSTPNEKANIKKTEKVYLRRSFFEYDSKHPESDWIR
jgi:hypothetical protein